MLSCFDIFASFHAVHEFFLLDNDSFLSSLSVEQERMKRNNNGGNLCDNSHEDLFDAEELTEKDAIGQNASPARWWKWLLDRQHCRSN